MLRRVDDADMSELERELEREMELEVEDRPEPGDREISLELESPEEGTAETQISDYGDRFYELASREFETPDELDGKVNEIVDDMERDFFFGSLGKWIKKAGKTLLKKGIKLASRLPIPGAQFISKGIEAATQLARGDLKGLLGSLAKTALGSVIPGRGDFSSLAKAALGAAVPGGAALVPVLSALGFEATEDPETNRKAWYSFAEVSRESFEHLAKNLNASSDDPLEAARQANEAFQSGLKRIGETRVGRTGSSPLVSGRREIRVRSGDVVIVRGV